MFLTRENGWLTNDEDAGGGYYDEYLVVVVGGGRGGGGHVRDIYFLCIVYIAVSSFLAKGTVEER